MVLHTNESTLEPERVITLSIKIEELKENTQEELRNGILFSSLAEIDAYFEGMES